MARALWSETPAARVKVARGAPTSPCPFLTRQLCFPASSSGGSRAPVDPSSESTRVPGRPAGPGRCPPAAASVLCALCTEYSLPGALTASSSSAPELGAPPAGVTWLPCRASQGFPVCPLRPASWPAPRCCRCLRAPGRLASAWAPQPLHKCPLGEHGRVGVAVSPHRPSWHPTLCLALGWPSGVQGRLGTGPASGRPPPARETHGTCRCPSTGPKLPVTTCQGPSLPGPAPTPPSPLAPVMPPRSYGLVLAAGGDCEFLGGGSAFRPLLGRLWGPPQSAGPVGWLQ